ncbi:hypothetical protein CHS0354_041608 [Potamilus streckersoni]|uniref:Nucleolar and spindle-associated protein 1 n=1 Tax=Potamilus streckersoni TaxID=2493646 RepID=A0AAE0SHI9_9BIVA|nr:hypothetical protein CHS0354_041608 [Potamilus streckersoni]
MEIDLKSLKYSELQQLAKKVGIKANVKQSRLIQTLRSYYDQEKSSGDAARDLQAAKDLEEKPKDNKKNKKGGKKKNKDDMEGNGTEEEPQLKKRRSTFDKAASIKSNREKASDVGMENTASATNTTATPEVNSDTKPVASRKAYTPMSLTSKGLRRVGTLNSLKKCTPRTNKTSRSTQSTPRTGIIKSRETKTAMSNTPNRRSTFEKAPTPQLLKTTPDEDSPPCKKRRETFEKAPTPNLQSATPQIDSKSDESNTSENISSVIQFGSSPNFPSGQKRRSTFEKAPTPELSSLTPSLDSSKRKRSSQLSTPKSASPGIQHMLDAMKPEMDDSEMKKSLMSVLDKTVKSKMSDNAGSSVASSGIPRFAAFLSQRKGQKKTMTPGNKDWEKIHRKEFKKFDSIDVYLQKKKERAEAITASVKKTQKLLHQLNVAADKLISRKSLNNENKLKNRASHARSTLFKSPASQAKSTPFKPTVLNIEKINLEFASMQSPKSMLRKATGSAIKKEQRKSGSQTKTTGSSLRRSGGEGSVTVTRKSTTTPFKFTGNISLNTTQSAKKTFDLKASLARPLTWKPHSGKLKPMGGNTPIYISKANNNNTSQNITICNPAVTKIRDQKRVDIAKRREDKKNSAMMARRGISVS